MNCLLDTHVFLWALCAPEKLTAESRRVIQSPANAVFVSAISGAEIAIKKAMGKLEAPRNLMSEIDHRGMQHMPLHYRHTETLETMELHHSDPFDRLLIAQALCEDLVVVTHDEKFRAYPVRILWT